MPDGTRLKKIDPSGDVTLYLGYAEIRDWGGPNEYVLAYPFDFMRYVEGEGLSTLHRDQLNSVRAISDSSGDRAKRTAYLPFGEGLDYNIDPSVAVETKGFIGERYDEDAGLQYLNARYYDPDLGRFIQPDWWEVTEPRVGTNRYAYSFNDPINLSDPGGNLTTPDGEALIAYTEGDSDELPENHIVVDDDHLRSKGLSDYQIYSLNMYTKRHGGKAFYNSKANEHSIVSRNTDPTVQSWAHSILQGIGYSTEYSAAISNARTRSRYATKWGADLSFAGDSQGSGLANAMARAVGNPSHMESVVTNPATVSRGGINTHGLDSTNPSLDISSRVVRGEAITTMRSVALVAKPTRAVLGAVGLTIPHGQTTTVNPPPGTSRSMFVRHNYTLLPK